MPAAKKWRKLKSTPPQLRILARRRAAREKSLWHPHSELAEDLREAIRSDRFDLRRLTTSIERRDHKKVLACLNGINSSVLEGIPQPTILKLKECFGSALGDMWLG